MAPSACRAARTTVAPLEDLLAEALLPPGRALTAARRRHRMTRQYRPLDRPASALNSAGLDMDQGMERSPIRLRARHTFWRRHPTAAPDAPTTHWVPEGWVIFPSFAIGWRRRAHGGASRQNSSAERRHQLATQLRFGWNGGGGLRR